MENKELDFLKKKYGESFARLCRNLFPTILEEEGALTKIITEKFYESKFLFEDIIGNQLIDDFKNYVFSFVEKKPTKIDNKVIENPFVLMAKAGYKLYKCETDEDVKAFQTYYEPNEALCTFRDKSRIHTSLIFFAVKENVGEIRRENFTDPKRQDGYGTSVISLQFRKGEKNTLSIKNRYNHTVENPDATFSNDLENIIAGLTESFVKEYGLNLIATRDGFEIPGYVMSRDGKLYKYNHEIDNVYYCPDNIVLHERRDVFQHDKDNKILMEYFVLDLKNKKLESYNANVDDSFADYFKDLDESAKIQVQKDGANRVITISQENREDVVIAIDKYNRIIKYKNNNLTQVRDNFLRYSKALGELEMKNVKTIGKNCCNQNKALTALNIENIESIRESSFNNIDKLQALNLPNLKTLGDYCFSCSSSLTDLNLESVEHIGDRSLIHVGKLTTLSAPNLKTLGEYCFVFVSSLTELNLESMERIGDKSFSYVDKLTRLNAPNLIFSGNYCFNSVPSLTELNLESIESIGNKSFVYIDKLTILSAPNLKTIGYESFYFNKVLKDVSMPKIIKIGDGVLASHPNREIVKRLKSVASRNERQNLGEEYQ